MAKLKEILEEVKLKTTKNNEHIVLTSSQNGIVSQTEYFKKEIAGNNVGYKVIKKGEFTYRSMSDTGYFYINLLKEYDVGIVSPAYPVFRIKDESIMKPEYLELFFHSLYFLEQTKKLAKGSTRLSLKYKQLEDIEIDLISIEDQEKIININNLYNKMIKNRESQKEDVEKLLYVEFNERFCNDNYNKEKLKNSVEEMFIGPFGSSLKNEYFVPKENAECMVYEQKHAINHLYNIEPTRYVAKEKYEELKRFEVIPGDMIISCRGTVGKIYVLPDDAPKGIIHPSLMKIRVKSNCYNPEFLVFLLERKFEEETNRNLGSSVKMGITAKELGQTEFIIPSIEEQNDFVDYLYKYRKLNTLLENDIADLKMLSSALINNKKDY